MNITKLILLLLFLTPFMGRSIAHAQKVSDEKIGGLIQSYKQDARGPYKDIRWFCKDGSTVAPQERCPEPGVQRARYKTEVINLAKTNKIYLGQILSTTDYADFWDAKNHHSRLKQYQLENFLKANDNGWVNQKAQFYRGAVQTEDEEAWGIEFFKWALKNPSNTDKNYFLLRQSAKDVPHNKMNNLSERVRANSKEIAENYAAFMNLRVKIHGQPEKADIQKVKAFQSANDTKMPPQVKQKMGQLIADMELLFAPVSAKDFDPVLNVLPKTSKAKELLANLVRTLSTEQPALKRCEAISSVAIDLRSELNGTYTPEAKLALIDASIKLEQLLMRDAIEWKPKTLQEQMQKIHCLTEAAAGFGYLEKWEWTQIASAINPPNAGQIRLDQLGDFSEQARSALEWCTAMVRTNYADVVAQFNGFEPLANGFIDDRVRASVLLPLGSAVSELGDLFSKYAGFSNQVLNIPNQSSFRGLNPGFAMGELVVTDRSPDEIEVDANKIYVFDRPPADLKPVAGIATVTEGNMVSHVQLLARNLGIPNAVLSKENLRALMPFNGQKVFFAVSNKGSVIIKPADQMTSEEKALFTKRTRSEEKISVPMEEMELANPRVVNLREVSAANSGKLCGPKAANLGQLKQLYPDNVVEGLVIPFALFKAHFDQQIPGTKQTYWQSLNTIFKEGDAMVANGGSEQEVETFILGQLAIFRERVKKIALLPQFEEELKAKFISTFGGKMGTVPVFLRSDTNMEDLKDFTGAGLNLTLFNVLDVAAIWQGIKDVWASPYVERSYRWRQRYLNDPANVFPSILIIPSVNAEVSGVMITKGVSTGVDTDITLAFNRGVGGAVEGQASESWLLKSNGNSVLISPAREAEYMSIPNTGGTLKIQTTFDERLLTEDRLKALRAMAEKVKKDLTALGIKGPYDMELGFKDEKIWLFQVRPFVENKRAAASDYLGTISPKLNTSELIPLNTKI